tara:strand:- start:380 stop:511 length:132 start_codon:yes stop_codon:yes gene_type:complete
MWPVIAGAINAVEMALVKLNQIYLALFAQYQSGNVILAKLLNA